MNHRDCKTKKHETFIRNAQGKITSILNDLECLDHSVICCRCGEEWGRHPATSVVEPSKECAWCKAELPGTEEYYNQHGNACIECRSKFANNYRTNK